MKGKLSINRVFNGDSGFISIVLTDSNSFLEVGEIQVGLSDFTEAITGLGYTDCTYNLRDNRELLGKTREVKTELLPRENTEEHLPAYEVDGWRCIDRKDLSNSHNWRPNNQIVVSFVRFV